jgi:hypothetical protein
MTCDAPVAVVSVVEHKGGYIGIGRNGLPESPLPLVRVLMQHSGCFRIVDRNSGLESTVREQELEDKAILRADAEGNVKKGRGILSMIGLDKIAGFASQVKFKETQVVRLLTDNETTEQLSSATGSAHTADLGLGGLVAGKGGGAGGMGWRHTNEGKVISAAFLDAHNNLVVQARTLAAKALPEAVAVKKKADQAFLCLANI